MSFLHPFPAFLLVSSPPTYYHSASASSSDSSSSIVKPRPIVDLEKMSLTLPPRVPESSEPEQPKYQTAIQQFKQLVVGVMEWTKRKYNEQYERWVPWLEDWYLKLFTKDNKASYATKDQLAKTKVSGNDDVDALQDEVHATAATQLGQEGLARPVGDFVSKEGLNRAERGGKDENAKFVPGQGEAAGAAEAAPGGKSKGKGWFGGRK